MNQLQFDMDLLTSHDDTLLFHDESEDVPSVIAELFDSIPEEE